MDPATPTLDLSGTVAARIRHDLRNPLSDILGFCDVLKEEAAEQNLDQLLPQFATIHDAASHIFAEINHTLNPENLKFGKTDLSGLGDTILLHAEKILSSAESLSEMCDRLELNAFGDDLLRITSSARKLRDEAPALLRRLREAPADEGAPSPLLSSLDTDHLTATPDGKASRASLLVVDDNESNRALLARRLRRQGYTVSLAENGRQALDKLRLRRFDLVLLDVIMPEMDGYRVLSALKVDEALRHIPVIMVSALDDLEVLVRCVEAGAEDYLAKPFDPVLLKARIDSCLEKKRLHDQEQRTYQALVESQRRLANELAEAGRYVQSLLPSPVEGRVTTDWQFLPSAQLGGDAFDYFWLDDDHFMFYLLDVCSHGVGAALLSISVMNVLRSRALANVNFRNPASVLTSLNDAFPMEKHQHMFFTLWYGVYQPSTRKLAYSSGGHPPALLLSPSGDDTYPLQTGGALVGAMPGTPYTSAEITVPAQGTIYVFSDGAYEIVKPDGHLMTLRELLNHLNTQRDRGGTTAIVEHLRQIGKQTDFDDDLSLLQLRFE